MPADDGGAKARTELLEAAQAWAEDDPDPVTRGLLHGWLEEARRGGGGADIALERLADAFSGFLEFGTAGLRGPLGPGPSRMNRALVVRAAAGLTAYLREEHREPFVVVGFDARTGSDVFARDTAAVVTGAGGRAAALPRALPTPVLAFAVRHLGADAGVMVTASHNPATDSGYKVYLGDGIQIAPPVDAHIARHIARVRAVAAVPLAAEGWETLDETVLEAYLDAAVAVVAPGSAREVTVVHTALHGVGGDVVRAAFTRAGFPAPTPVPSQQEPDAAFPTVPFPNPEEPGALDAALALARERRPDLVVASDPDADRCAVAVPADGDWRVLTGDELGALLGAHLLARGVDGEAVLASSVVSSRLLAAMARAAGVRHVETLTGFKWIARVPGLRYGYEEALGYCVGDLVRDKDGVTAALVAVQLGAALKASGQTIRDRLAEIFRAHGVHVTRQRSLRIAGADWLDRVTATMASVRATPPTSVAGRAVVEVEDLLEGCRLPPSDVLIWTLDGARLVVRPSGTEPKLKCYAETVIPVAEGGDVWATRAAADAVVDDVLAGAASLLAEHGL